MSQEVMDAAVQFIPENISPQLQLACRRLIWELIHFSAPSAAIIAFAPIIRILEKAGFILHLTEDLKWGITVP